MKKENYYKWNDASISDIEWEQMMGETDFEYPKAFSSLVHFIKSLSEEEEKAFINKIEKLEMENEEERKKQLLNMKSYFIKIGVRCMEDKYTVKEIKQNLYCHMIMIVYGLLNSQNSNREKSFILKYRFNKNFTVQTGGVCGKILNCSEGIAKLCLALEKSKNSFFPKL